MKLQKRFNRKVPGKEYSKWVVVLPNDKVEELGWKEGVELDLDSKKGTIILRPKDSNN
ncbi:MAG: AbrB/MazE/SpoVT family DNA-binding domain-containing protein [Nitrososphaeraceae archaeon]